MQGGKVGFLFVFALILNDNKNLTLMSLYKGSSVGEIVNLMSVDTQR